jgi:hypothetical protein
MSSGRTTSLFFHIPMAGVEKNWIKTKKNRVKYFIAV